jgi:tRNA A-37 threonylcarbamoyl transferase component Bud32/tetratricopeptide (TPR) repeat protein
MRDEDIVLGPHKLDSGPDTGPRRGDTVPVIGPALHGLGSRLRRAFTFDSQKSHSNHQLENPTTDSELSNVIFLATGTERRAHSFSDYRNTAERIRGDLKTHKKRLYDAIENYPPGSGSERGLKDKTIALSTLALIQESLGEYKEAQDIYHCLFPTLGPPILKYKPVSAPSSDPLQHVISGMKNYELDILIKYCQFLTRTHQDLELSEKIGTLLLENPLFSNWTSGQQCGILLCLSRTHLHREQYELAQTYLDRLKDLLETNRSGTPQTTISMSLRQAIVWSNLNKWEQARTEFVMALITSAVICGMWHDSTLDILFYYGESLKNAGNNRAAAKILGECCLGRLYRLGEDHPSSHAALSALHSCSGSNSDLENTFEKIRQLINPFSDQETKTSIAFEHTFLNTMIDLLIAAGDIDFDEVEKALVNLKKQIGPLHSDTSDHRSVYILRIIRALAKCRFEEGQAEYAMFTLDEGSFGIKRSAEGGLQSKLDVLTFCSNNDIKTPEQVSELSRALFFHVGHQIHRDQTMAYHRKLAQLGCTHFSQESLINNPLPIKVLENVGTGAYAIVESVDISGRLYARKSIALPRYNQTRVRKTIQNEISVIRSLAHPHIVQVHFTYEEKSRFAIVLQPLADYDLEAYLEQNSPDEDQTGRWLRCLANTLAFIHSKGIRHKDIKTRNILIKDDEVIFADFGSSHAFLDEGHSTTEGPAFGHTVMYCAPEVISAEKRSRSADIFSLGCVFTELATSLDERSISDYYDFRAKSDGYARGETHAYFATLDLVDAWFLTASDQVKSLYKDVIKPMLSTDPELRPTAVETSDAVEVCFEQFMGVSLSVCAQCDPFRRHSMSVSTDLDPS